MMNEVTNEVEHIEAEKNGRHLTDDIFKCVFVNEKFCIVIKISLMFVTNGSIDSNSVLVEVMA